jgi:endonuclease YncB( thermonuclease family)
VAAVESVIRPRAQVRRVRDGDTYELLLDVLNNGFKVGAVTAEVRLRDFSCPERYTAEGRHAREVAEELLAGGEVVVELRGERTFGRLVGWVWVAGEALGPELVARGVAQPGARVG